MTEQYVDVVEWARTVGPEEPHGPRDLEDVLLQDHPGNEARLERREDESPWALARGIWGLFYISAPFLPIAGPVLFRGGWYRGNEIDATDIGTALPWSGVLFWCAAAFWVNQLVRWWGFRYRSAFGMVIAAANIVLAGMTLRMATADLDRFHGNAMLHLIPMWATIVLAGLVIGVYAVSPPAPRFARVLTTDLTDESRDLLLEERESALRVLAERGMLENDPVESLSSRPLGRLHVTSEDIRAEE